MANEITLHQVNEAAAYNYETFGSTNQAKAAGCFKPAVAGVVLTEISARMEHQGTPTDEVRCKVYSNDSTSNEPDTLLATSTNTIDPSGYTYKTWNFDGSLTLEKDTVYWVVFERTGSLSADGWRFPYYPSANQILTDECLYWNSSTSTWAAHPSGQIYIFDVRGESSSIEELVNYQYEYDAYYNCLYSTTYYGIAQKFKTPSNVDGNTYLIDAVSCGFGKFSSPSAKGKVEIHSGTASSLDLNASSTTRVGAASNVHDVPVGTYYQGTQGIHFTWDTDKRPELQHDTVYWLVFLPDSSPSGGGWRVGQDNTNPKGDGYTGYRVSNTGSLTSTGANEVWTNMWILGSQRASVGRDVIIPWTIVDFDSITLNKDTIIPWLLSIDVKPETVLRWDIKETWEWVLPWRISLDVGQDNSIRWKILNEAQYDFLLRWGLLVETDTIIPWVLRPLITRDWIFPIPIRMDADFVLKWGLNYRLSSDVVFRWIIDSRVWKDIALKYHIKVEADHILLIPLRSQISKDIIISSHLTADITADEILRFNIREFNQVDADNKLRWVLEGRPRFYKITFT